MDGADGSRDVGDRQDAGAGDGPPPIQFFERDPILGIPQVTPDPLPRSSTQMKNVDSSLRQELTTPCFKEHSGFQRNARESIPPTGIVDTAPHAFGPVGWCAILFSVDYS